MKILFYNQYLYKLFLYGLSGDCEFQYKERVNINNNSFDLFESNDYSIYLFNSNPISSDLLKIIESEYFDLYCIRFWDIYTNSISLNFLKNINSNILIIDILGERSDYNFDEFKNVIENNNHLFFISNRFLNLNHERIITNLQYTNLLYYYFWLVESYYIHPILPDLKSNKKPYDFITYIGLRDDRNWRNDILNKIDFKNHKLLIPNSFKSLKSIQKEMSKFMSFPNGGLGNYNYFSLIESESAKIKLVFETQDPVSDTDVGFIVLTEKTLKCFLHTQPYIIFMNPIQKIELKKIGFKFAEPDDIEKIITYINNIGNIDEWMENNSHIFNHNKELMNQIVYDSNQPHIQFIKKIKNYGTN